MIQESNSTRIRLQIAIFLLYFINEIFALFSEVNNYADFFMYKCFILNIIPVENLTENSSNYVS